MKSEVMRRKQAMLAAHAREREAQLAASAAQRAAEAETRSPKILLYSPASYFNEAWFRRWLRGAAVLPNFTLPEHTVPTIGGRWFSFADLEERLDLGLAAVGLMGAVEVFCIRDFAEVRGYDRALLGLPAFTNLPIHLQAKTKEHGLVDLFQTHRGEGAGRPYELLSDWTSWFPKNWATIGNPQTLDDTLPLEVVYCHRSDVILAVRHAPELLQPAEATTAPAAEAGEGQAPAPAAPAPASPASTSARRKPKHMASLMEEREGDDA